MYIDSHCHVNFPELLTNIDSVIERMKIKNVSHALVVGIDNKSSKSIINIVNQYKNLWAAIGVHPNTHVNDDLTYDELYILSKNEKVIAIGETGLDYSHSNLEINDIQKNRLRKHMQVSITSNLPLIIHTRLATNDTIDILKEEQSSINGVIHCFTESMDFAKKILDMNFLISVSGIITFKNAQDLRDIIKYVPLDRLLIETDSPFLSPEPYRGKINEPSNVILVAQKIAEIKNTSIEIVANATTKNFFNLFKKISINK